MNALLRFEWGTNQRTFTHAELGLYITLTWEIEPSLLIFATKNTRCQWVELNETCQIVLLTKNVAMIVSLSGKLIETGPLEAVVEVHGVGYLVQVPLPTLEKLPSPGNEVRLHTHQVFREDAQLLFGFYTKEERSFFRLLVDHVSGIGPKIALNILSRLSLPVLRQAIASGDVGLLSKIPGIGKKTAERLVIELKDKVGLPTASADIALSGTGGVPPTDSISVSTAINDAVAALMALGYKPVEADKAVRKAQSSLGNDATVEKLIKKALSGS